MFGWYKVQEFFDPLLWAHNHPIGFAKRQKLGILGKSRFLKIILSWFSRVLSCKNFFLIKVFKSCKQNLKFQDKLNIAQPYKDLETVQQAPSSYQVLINQGIFDTTRKYRKELPYCHQGQPLMSFEREPGEHCPKVFTSIRKHQPAVLSLSKQVEGDSY